MVCNEGGDVQRAAAVGIAPVGIGAGGERLLESAGVGLDYRLEQAVVSGNIACRRRRLRRGRQRAAEQ